MKPVCAFEEAEAEFSVCLSVYYVHSRLLPFLLSLFCCCSSTSVLDLHLLLLLLMAKLWALAAAAVDAAVATCTGRR